MLSFRFGSFYIQNAEWKRELTIKSISAITRAKFENLKNLPEFCFEFKPYTRMHRRGVTPDGGDLARRGGVAAPVVRKW